MQDKVPYNVNCACLCLSWFVSALLMRVYTHIYVHVYVYINFFTTADTPRCDETNCLSGSCAIPDLHLDRRAPSGKSKTQLDKDICLYLHRSHRAYADLLAIGIGSDKTTLIQEYRTRKLTNISSDTSSQPTASRDDKDWMGPPRVDMTCALTSINANCKKRMHLALSQGTCTREIIYDYKYIIRRKS
jgi:hypothetical protein